MHRGCQLEGRRTKDGEHGSRAGREAVEPGDAYSSWFSVTSERVHVTDNLNRIFNDGFESAGTGAWSATLP